MGKADLVRAEESLKDFLLNEYRVENTRAMSQGRERDVVDITKYRRLILSFNDSGGQLLILVQIGPQSAVFNVEIGKKIEGGMSNEDSILIETWISMKGNKEILKNLAKRDSFHEKFIEIKPLDNI